ncbi:MAG TPA: Gldg family protein [Spirillospora sp.]|nr:Gldg family protein [Spirillospora sp.]
MNNQHIIVTRRQIGQWASYAAGSAFVLGIIGLIWQGGLTPPIIAALAVAVVSVILWAAAAPADFTGFITGRQVRYSTAAVFTSLLLVGIVALVYILLQRAALTLDMTEGRRFTLSPETLEILERVNRPIRITGFYDSTAVPAREVDDQFFRLYEAVTNGLISRQYIDPNQEPALAQRFGAYQNGAVFISYLNPDGSVDFSSLARVPRQPGGAQERELTQAILRLLAAGTFKVYFEVGHSELDPQDTGPQGLSGVHLGMQESGLVTDSLVLPALAANGQSIPDDASVVIMARPTRALTSPEIAVLDEYLQRGGSLFIMAEALLNEGAFLSGETEFNHYLWDNFGLSALNAVIVDYSSNLRTPLDIIGYQVFTGTDIGARLDPAQAPTLFRIARALNVNDDPPVHNGRVIMSSPDSYGETNFRALMETNSFAPDPEVDPPGPLTSVAWAWDETTNAKIILVGDADFVTNGFVSSALGNAVLFTDGIAWLTGLNERVSFAPQAFVTAPPLIFVSTQTLDVIAFLTVILMPGLLLISGLVIWSWRMRQ